MKQQQQISIWLSVSVSVSLMWFSGYFYCIFFFCLIWSETIFIINVAINGPCVCFLGPFCWLYPTHTVDGFPFFFSMMMIRSFFASGGIYIYIVQVELPVSRRFFFVVGKRNRKKTRCRQLVLVFFCILVFSLHALPPFQSILNSNEKKRKVFKFLSLVFFVVCVFLTPFLIIIYTSNLLVQKKKFILLKTLRKKKMNDKREGDERSGSSSSSSQSLGAIIHCGS